MIPQRVIDHWRNEWRWTDEQIEQAISRYQRSVEHRVFGLKPRPSGYGCERCNIEPMARRLCHKCYQRWWRKQRKNRNGDKTVPRRNANGFERMSSHQALAIISLILEQQIETETDALMVAELREALAVLERRIKPIFEVELAE